MIMKKFSLLIPILILTSQISWSQIDPVAYWDFDELRVERKIVDMVRGETYVPKEVFAYVKESVSGKEFDLEGKYYLSVNGVKNKAVLLDGYMPTQKICVPLLIISGM
jgi:hypothetical protein